MLSYRGHDGRLRFQNAIAFGLSMARGADGFSTFRRKPFVTLFTSAQHAAVREHERSQDFFAISA
jgi:hypothetical protein